MRIPVSAMIVMPACQMLRYVTKQILARISPNAIAHRVHRVLSTHQALIWR